MCLFASLQRDIDAQKLLNDSKLGKEKEGWREKEKKNGGERDKVIFQNM